MKRNEVPTEEKVPTGNRTGGTKRSYHRARESHEKAKSQSQVELGTGTSLAEGQRVERTWAVKCTLGPNITPVAD